MSRQVIKYQSTTVEPEISASHITRLVRAHGGVEFSHRWEADQLSEVAFTIEDERFGRVPIRLGARTETIQKILMERTTMGRDRARAQAYRIAWRQLKDLTEQLLLAVQTGLFTLTEAFMSGVETEDPETGEVITMGQLVERHATQGGPRGLLLAGTPEADFEVVD